MTQYPIILIPPQIEYVKSAQPPAQPFTQSLPTRPGAQPKKFNFTLIGIETAVAVPLAAIISQITSIPIPLIFLVAVGAIAFQSWSQIASYPERREQYNRQANEYSEKLRFHELRKLQHERETQTANSPQRIAEFRYKLLLDVLTRTISHDSNSSVAPKGAAEAQFSSHLSRYFPGKIHTGLTLKIPNFPHPYTPDFAYIDQGLNLYPYCGVKVKFEKLASHKANRCPSRP